METSDNKGRPGKPIREDDLAVMLGIDRSILKDARDSGEASKGEHWQNAGQRGIEWTKAGIEFLRLKVPPPCLDHPHDLPASQEPAGAQRGPIVTWAKIIGVPKRNTKVIHVRIEPGDHPEQRGVEVCIRVRSQKTLFLGRRVPVRSLGPGKPWTFHGRIPRNPRAEITPLP